MSPPTLLAVPNVSEGQDAAAIEAIAAAVAPDRDAEQAAGGVRLLDIHSDADHDRSVLTFAGPPGALADALLRCAAAAIERIDLRRPGRAGQHPHVGAVDVAPVVYLTPESRGAACAEALVVADRIGNELGIPVFLYGQLTGASPRTRADLRRGGIAALAARMAEPDQKPLRPDFGPAQIDPRHGATLVAARPPLVAFNLELAAPATLEQARGIAALIREGGKEGLPGLRAIGIELAGGRPQVSMNVERPFELTLASVVEAVARHAPLVQAELVGLAPAAALAGFPPELAMPGFDPARQVIENALGS
jgi:glutamate formiminotransferase / 5-formyltetrahydrofolate cyclo-ligase